MLRAGSSVSLTLYFMRFAMGLNAALAAFWLAGTVIPFLISPPSTFSWQYFKAYRPTDLLQGYGLHNTFLLYGECSHVKWHSAQAASCCMPPSQAQASAQAVAQISRAAQRDSVLTRGLQLW